MQRKRASQNRWRFVKDSPRKASNAASAANGRRQHEETGFADGKTSKTRTKTFLPIHMAMIWIRWRVVTRWREIYKGIESIPSSNFPMTRQLKGIRSTIALLCIEGKESKSLMDYFKQSDKGNEQDQAIQKRNIERRKCWSITWLSIRIYQIPLTCSGDVTI